jgi:hypothetical protein
LLISWGPGWAAPPGEELASRYFEAHLLASQPLGKPPDAAAGEPGIPRQFIDYSTLHCEAFEPARARPIITAGTYLSFLPVLLGLVAAQPAAMQQTVTRLIIQDEVILRVPIAPRPLGPSIQWVEHKGPKCIPTGAIRGALLSGPEQVDFIVGNRTRVRAKFDEDCPALDFYGGFYLQPDGDRLCAGRDAIHSRMGGSCTIERFSLLEPKLR